MAGAVDETDFEVKTTEDLITLCTASPDDPLHAQAVNFCHGYLVGAYHYYEAVAAGPEGIQLVCPPDPAPSRNETIASFIDWARAHPQYWNEPPVETEFRFLIETWPCNP
jgi:hypothetical protein